MEICKFPFQNLKPEYQQYFNSIHDKVVIEIYSKFTFYYLNLDFFTKDELNNRDDIKNCLFNYINDYKFITYQIFKKTLSKLFVKNILKQQKEENNHNLYNIVICTEDECIIIEEIDMETIEAILKNKKEKSMINVGSIYLPSTQNNENLEANEEVDSFIHYFRTKISNNPFVHYTIRSIACFLIRRHFYPTIYFNNSDFFFFEPNEKPYEKEFKRKLIKLLYTNNVEEINPEIFDKFYLKDNENKLRKIHEFENKDFIKLRFIYKSGKDIFYLAIHINTQHIFLMKMFNDPQFAEEHKHEIEFCQSYSHRCLTHFYGFVKENGQIIGFIYEYLNNGPLSKHLNKFNKTYSLITMIRIFQGINYLHENSLVHRDLNPSNILLDHDFIPYISDFETIRKTIDKRQMNENEKYSYNFGVLDYISPEQYFGLFVSYPIDIYSFGLIVYFLYEHKNVIENNRSIVDQFNELDQNITLMKNSPKGIQLLFNMCVRYKQEERIKNREIFRLIKEEVNSISDFELNLSDENVSILLQYFYELISILIQLNDKKQLQKLIYNVYLYLLLQVVNNNNIFHFFLNLINRQEKESDFNASNLFLNIGNFYKNENNINKDYLKAKNYYEISAKLNNSYALSHLGYLYKNGYGVKNDYLKSKEYYELAAQQNNPIAFNGLGNLYLNGLGVKKDYSKAKNYYELSAKGNNSDAFNNIGKMYHNGYGVERDYSKAKKYYKMAVKLNNSYAMNNLGFLYEVVEQDFMKAIKYYELSAKQNNSHAFVNLACLYKSGFGVKQDYLKAKYYLEKAAAFNNTNALNYLGSLYFNGEGVEKNYLKAKEFYEKSANLNNSNAYDHLGDLYYYGYGVKQDYLKAKDYYEISASKNNLISMLKIGDLYYNGYGVKQDYLKAKQYYELSAKNSNYSSFFNLGTMYINGEGINIDYLKAIQYFTKCTETNGEKMLYESNGFYNIKYNNHYYPSNNNIGLIYMTNEKLFNLELACKFIKEAAFNEFQFGQNNYGLICLFYLNKLSDAKYMFKKASKSNFALSEFNLGYLKEKNGKIQKAIKYYSNALDHENEPFIFHRHEIKDKQLNASKSLILFFANLKLTYFYLSKDKLKEEDYKNAEEYFLKIISKIKNYNQNSFFHIQIKINKDDNRETDIFLFLKNSIIYSLYLSKSNKNSKENDEIENGNEKIFHEFPKENSIDLENKKQKENKFVENIKSINDELVINEDLINEDLNVLFDKIVKNEQVLNSFLSTISGLINLLNSILYTSPYHILFGRVFPNQTTPKISQNPNNLNVCIDKSFYDGFET